MAETAVVIPINVRDNNATVGLERARKSVEKLTDEVKKSSDVAKQATQSSSSLANSIAGMALKFFSVSAVAAGFYKTLSVGLKETMELEKATKLLSAQYRALGVTNQAVIDDVITYVSALAQKTAQDESDLINIAKLISSFGIYGEALKEATAATLDISAAMGIDQETAARAVGKALAGSTEALQRYGIAIKDAGAPTATLANLMQELRAKGFSGAAAAEAETFGGAIRGLAEAFKDFAQAIVNFPLFGWISITEIAKEWVDIAKSATKGVANILSGTAGAPQKTFSIEERNAKKEIVAINKTLQAQADRRIGSEDRLKKLAKEEADLKKRLKEWSDETEVARKSIYAEAKSALSETKSEEERINEIQQDRIAIVEKMVSLKQLESKEAEKLKKIFEDTANFEKTQLENKNLQQTQQAGQGMMGAVGSGNVSTIASQSGGQIAAAASVVTIFFKMPQIIQQLGQSISDLFTDWIDGWQDIHDIFSGSLEVFGSRADALAGSIANFDERMKDLEQSIEDAAMAARGSSDNLAVYNDRVQAGQGGIKAITADITGLLQSRTEFQNEAIGFAGLGILKGENVRIHEGSREELNKLFDELEANIQEQTQLLQNQHAAALQVIAEEYAARREQLQGELDLITKQVQAWQGVQEGFENVKKSIAGTFLSPEQNTASAMAAFQSATGADKAQAAMTLQQSLLSEFQAAQQAAAAGLITQEELKAKQAAVLAQLEMAQAEAKSAEQLMLDKQTAIENAILQLNEDEKSAVAAQNEIYLAQLQELKDIRNILAGTQQFQEGGQVNKTGFAFVHEGENVIPKGGATGNVNIVINGRSAGSGSDFIGLLQEALKTNRGGIRDTLKRLI